MTASAWIQCAKPISQPRMRIFCFPYAGGSGSIFRKWHKDLPADIEVFAIQLPGRENRLQESLYTNLSHLIDKLSTVIHPYLNIPFVFFGHSLGALVSFELARRLRRQRAPEPAQLFVSAHRAPHLADPDPPIYQLPEAEFVEEIRKYQGTPEEVLQHKELRELILPILRADFTICQTYSYLSEAPLNCPIAVFGGLQDDIEKSALTAWQEHTNSAFSLRMLPGGHFFINDYQPILLQALNQDLRALPVYR